LKLHKKDARFREVARGLRVAKRQTLVQDGDTDDKATLPPVRD
jgi:hypothetical protein